MKVLCLECDTDCTEHYLVCDIQDGTWCPYCFDNTLCGRGEHGEGCPTSVFSDKENESEETTGLTDLSE